MEELHNLRELSHRSRERIKNLGEVFTPEHYVEQMLDILSEGKKGFWGEENNIFFEPTCGHGNIILPIVQRRLEGLYKKAQSKKIKNPELYAVANTINTIWAIDIDEENIELCRERVFSVFFYFIMDKRKVGIEDLLDSEFDFFVHLLCAIKWHIYENEALSSVSVDEDEAECSSRQTKLSWNWYNKNGFNPIDFSQSWISYFKDCDSKDLEPIEYGRAEKYLNNFLKGSKQGLSHFKFTKKAFTSPLNFEGQLNLEVI